MEIFSRFIPFLCVLVVFSACDSSFFKKKIDIDADGVVVDLRKEITELELVIKEINEEEIKLKAALEKKDLETEMRLGIKKEMFEGDIWEKRVFEIVAYRKIRLKKRLSTLKERNQTENDYSLITKKEADDYFTNKSVNPMKKGWENRFRTAIDLNP